MSKIKMEVLLPLMSAGSGGIFELVRVLKDYIELKEKLDDVENQSWYFKKGLESRIKRLNDLKKDFNCISSSFSDMTIEKCNKEIDRANEYINKIGYHLVASKYGFVYDTYAIIKYNHILIDFVNEIGEVRDLEYYLENMDEFKDLIQKSLEIHLRKRDPYPEMVYYQYHSGRTEIAPYRYK